MGLYCFGIDVGGTSVKCGLFLTDGTLIEKWEIPTRTENNGSEILPDVAKTIQAKIDERGIEKDKVDGVGIGIPGPVNEHGEVPCAVNLYWGFKAVSRELSELTGLAAQAGNDANVAALGEAWKGAAAGAKNVVMVTLGTGVGGGIIVDGKIVSGHHGAGGEVGHANINHNETESCNCGNKGCLEQVASATGIVRVAKQELAASSDESVLRNNSKLSAKAVLDAFKDGDAAAVRIMNKVGEELGGALAIFAAVIDPETIVVGGGVSKAGQPLIDCIQKYYREYAFSLCKDTPIVVASLGNDAGIYGAARMVIKEA
ncbi:ROK family glucokinase [Blautia schinkii]|nr:ROK family glucokinase [Blautia schinkii]